MLNQFLEDLKTFKLIKLHIKAGYMLASGVKLNHDFDIPLTNEMCDDFYRAFKAININPFIALSYIYKGQPYEKVNYLPMPIQEGLFILNNLEYDIFGANLENYELTFEEVKHSNIEIEANRSKYASLASEIAKTKNEITEFTVNKEKFLNSYNNLDLSGLANLANLENEFSIVAKKLGEYKQEANNKNKAIKESEERIKQLEVLKRNLEIQGGAGGNATDYTIQQNNLKSQINAFKKEIEMIVLEVESIEPKAIALSKQIDTLKAMKNTSNDLEVKVRNYDKAILTSTEQFNKLSKEKEEVDNKFYQLTNNKNNFTKKVSEAIIQLKNGFPKYLMDIVHNNKEAFVEKFKFPSSLVSMKDVVDSLLNPNIVLNTHENVIKKNLLYSLQMDYIERESGVKDFAPFYVYESQSIALPPFNVDVSNKIVFIKE